VASGAEAVFQRGAAALEAGDFAEAERLFRSIVEADPRVHPAWNALSVVAVRAGLPDVAAAHAQRALALDRRNPVYLNNLGVAYGELGEFTRAEEAFRRALKAKPAYAEGHFNLGKVLHKAGRLDESLRAYERAYALDPQFRGLRPSLSQMYRKHGRPDRALAVLRERPDGLEHNEIIPVVAQTIADAEGVDAGLAWLRGVVSRHPQFDSPRFTLGLLLLSLGQWREGWAGYLWRYNMFQQRGSAVPGPLPRRLDGKRVRLRGEQGMGDILFFLRFTGELRERGATVSALVPRKLAALGADLELLPLEDAAAAQAPCDYEVWCGDLPAVLDTEALPPAFALRRDEARIEDYRRRFAALGPPPYLGLTWRAGTDVLRNQEFGHSRAFLSKEVRPAALGEALRGWRGTLLALQRGPYAGEIEAVGAAAGARLHDLSALNDDLAEVLPALGALDEYVCVSNTNVHLLAGIGRTARVLVPQPAEWRWMRQGSSPWFPGFAVYREPQSRGWAEPLAKLRGDLIG
jgi:Tfp pilus assembly protein PilF